MKRLMVLTTLFGLGGCQWDTVAGPALRTGRVDVGNGVQLEYVEYGGQGSALVLLAGSGNSARIFDDFALRFRDRHRVVALTRRGFGGSSQPVTGYDTKTRAADIVRLLDRLEIARADVVGHSLAGDEMTRLAIDFPSRVGRLVYLDAGYNRVALSELVPYMPVPPAPGTADTRSIASYTSYLASVYGVRWPTAEVRNVNQFGPDGRLVGAVTPPRVILATLAGVEAPDYRSVRAPSLALYAVARGPIDIAPWLSLNDPEFADAAEYFTLGWQPFAAAERARFAAEMPNGRVVEIEGGNHYLFLSHPERVAAAIRAFLVRDR